MKIKRFFVFRDEAEDFLLKMQEERDKKEVFIANLKFEIYYDGFLVSYTN